MDDNISAQDLIYEAAKGEPWKVSGEKHIHNLPQLPEHLLVLFRFKSDGVEGLKKVLKSTSSLTPPSFSLPPYQGIPYFSFGQAIAKFGDINIHYKVQGITLNEFFEKYPNDAKQRMASWPQETFNNVARQAVMATRAGHALDIHGGNIIISDWDSNSPTITLIDLLQYNAAKDALSFANEPMILMKVFLPTDHEKEHPSLLVEKLLCAIKTELFGVQVEQQIFSNYIAGEYFGNYAPEIINQLFMIPCPLIPDQPLQHRLPDAFSGITTLAATANLGELRAFLGSIRKADKLAHPDWLQ